MCLHFWNFWQRHTWTRLDVLPVNQISNPWRLYFYLPKCAKFTYSYWKTDVIDVEINLFGLYKAQCDLEYGHWK